MQVSLYQYHNYVLCFLAWLLNKAVELQLRYLL